jgi:hypothetical protein
MLCRAAAVVLGYQLVGLLLGITETVQLAIISRSELHVATRQAFVVLVAAGTVLGLGAASIGWLRSRSRRIDVALAAACAGVAYALARSTFSGAWVSRQWYASYAPPIFAAVAGGLFFAWLKRAAPGAAAAVSKLALGLMALSAVALLCADALILAGLYPHVHVALVLVAWCLGGTVLGAVLTTVQIRPWCAGATAAAAILLSASLPVVYLKAPARPQRSLWQRTPSYAGKIVEPVRLALWMAYARNAQASGYTPHLASWVAEQPNRSTLGFERALPTWAQTVKTARSDPAKLGGKPHHILLITVDALRADVAVQGASMRELMARGRWYERAYSVGASTNFALATLVAGKADWREYDKGIIVALQAAGYETALAIHKELFDAFKERGEYYLSQPEKIVTVAPRSDGVLAPGLTDAALDIVSSRDASRPLFLWVHYYDVHEWEKLGPKQMSPRDRYLTVWKSEDAAIGRLVRGIEERLGRDNVATIVTSDHGEYLGELGRTAHGRWVARELVHIPMLLVAPSIPSRVISRPVGLIDVALTIAELAALPDFDSHGISLLQDDADPMRALVMADSREIGIVRGTRRLVVSPLTDGIELFDDTSMTSPALLPIANMQEVEAELLLPMLGSPLARDRTSPVLGH